MSEPTDGATGLPSHKELINRVAVIRAIKDAAKAAEDTVLDKLRQQLDPGDRLSAVVPGVGGMGVVYRTEDGVKAEVTDEAALVTYVAAESPQNIMQAVRPAFVELLLERARNGEVIPGIEASDKPGFVAVKVAPEQRARVIAALRDGRLVELEPDVLARRPAELP